MRRRRPARWLGIWLALAALFISACGAQDPDAGEYVCVERWVGRTPLGTADCVLELGAGGFGKLLLDGEGGVVRWKREGAALRLTIGDETYAGTVEDGLIRLEGPEKLTLVFAREELAQTYREELDARYEALGVWQAQWNGDWYGWWRIEESEGELEDTWYDLCARMVPQPDGGLYLKLWDEDGSESEPMGELLLRRGEDGSPEAEEGYFWLEEASESAWTLRLEEGFLRSEGRQEGSGESFAYTLCLRRWGESWPESGEQGPYYYTGWYLPLIKAGESMPDQMEPKDDLA